MSTLYELSQLKSKSAAALTLADGGEKTIKASQSAPSPNTPQLISTEAQALDAIGNGGRVIFLGDAHGSEAGHQALADLMPTLARSHVTAMAVELPSSMNDFLNNLQQNIRQQELSIAEVSAKLQKGLMEKGLGLVGDAQTFEDFSKILISASQQNIKIVGIDDRRDNTYFNEKLSTALRAHNQEKLDDVLFSMDPQNAQRVVELLKQQDPESRIAIMNGVRHGCEAESQLRLVTALRQQGVSVTSIALDQSSMTPDPGLCNAPPKIGLDANSVSVDVDSEQRRRFDAGSSKTNPAAKARPSAIKHSP